MDTSGEAEVYQLATRVLAGVALRSLRLSAASMSLPQFRLLALIEESGQITIERAAVALRLTESATTTLANRLITAGLAHRPYPLSPRAAVLEVTPRGRDTVTRVRHWRHQELNRILRRLAPAQRAVATDALRGFLGAAARVGYETGPRRQHRAARDAAPGGRVTSGQTDLPENR